MLTMCINSHHMQFYIIRNIESEFTFSAMYDLVNKIDDMPPGESSHLITYLMYCV